MALLLLFALIAGAGTALSPCVLPVLPAVLSAGVTGGRRRPLGVATGLALSFTFATVALVYLIDALGLADDLVRNVAIVVLAAIWLMLLVPPLSDRVEAFASRLSGGPRQLGGEGFLGGLLLGGNLGFVYAPCAGPILAGVITVSASQPLTAEKLSVALAYGIGSAVVIYAILLGGRRIVDRLTPIRGRVNYAMGAVMLAAAVMLFADLDIKFNTWLAGNAPAAVFNPTGAIEESSAVSDDLASLRGNETREAAGGAEASSGRSLPVLGRAPEFRDNQRWFNTPNEEPLTIRGLRGKVVLIDFWTYTCINCIRTFPYVDGWYERYRDDGLVVVGVHTPEFPFEKDAGNVEEAIGSNDLSYPVAQDNDFGTWNAYGNQYWPAKYLIDAQGRVRYVHFGEGEYDTTERAIRSLLAERGAGDVGDATDVRGQTPSRGVTTPEIYLGGARAERVANGPLLPGVNRYRLASATRLPPDHIGSRAGGESLPTRRPPSMTRSSGWSSVPGGCSWCSAPKRAHARCGYCSTASQSPIGSRAPTSAAAWRQSTGSGCMSWSTCPGSGATRWSSALRPVSRATRSRLVSRIPSSRRRYVAAQACQAAEPPRLIPGLWAESTRL